MENNIVKNIDNECVVLTIVFSPIFAPSMLQYGNDKNDILYLHFFSF